MINQRPALVHGVGGVAVLVEARKHPLLLKICENFLANLPNQWQRIVVYHCSFNEIFVKEQMSGPLQKGTVTLFNLETNKATRILWRKLQGKRKAFNRLMASSAFWNQVPAERVRSTSS
jgi:hypothetical protein